LRDSIVGDLREEFAELARTGRTRAARRWYWRQSAGIGLRIVATRLGAPRLARRSWLASADVDSTTSWRVGLVRDALHAWRAIASRPGTSAVIVCTLALTLAVNSTVFAILDALVLRPYRFPGVDRVVMVMSDSGQRGLPDRESVAAADFRDWRSDAHSVTHLAAAEWWDANLSGIETPQHVAGYRVTADFFDALGVAPVMGRDFVADEEVPGSHRRAVLGYGLWQRSFGAAADIVGKTIRLDGEPYEVVGVAAPGFAIPDGAEVWAPIAYSREEWANRRRGFLNVVGRLADGRSIEQVRSEIEAIVERQRREFPETNGNRPVAVTDFITGMADPGSGPFVATVQAAALLLMLIACANIANLLLARGTERAKEYAMRLALGASRGRIVWQTILEGTVLAAIAVVLAVPIGWALTGATRASIPPAIVRFIPGFDYIRLSPALFAALGLAAVVATLLFALMPAVHAARAGIQDGLRHGTRTSTSTRQRQRVRSALATAQVALTLALLFGSVLAVSATNRAANGAVGFDKNNLLVGALMLPERAYANPERRLQFIDGVLDRMRTIPAVSSIAMTNRLPYAGGNTRCEFWVEGVVHDSRDEDTVDCRRISAALFTTMRIPVVAGRTFNADDRRDTLPVAIVNRSLAERYWPAQDPIGRRFKGAENGQWISVVGVVGDVLHDWFMQRRDPTFYRPMTQDTPFGHWFVARTIGDPTSIASELRRAIAAVDPDQPVSDLKSMDELIEDRTSGLQFIARALTIVAIIAFALAMTGLYSLMAFMAARRTQEIGVRIALGANRWQVIRIATAPAVWITAGGITIGGLLAAGLGQLMASVLRGGVAANFWYLGVLILLLAFVALTAAYLPARRAAAIDPTVALRAE
jgi:putative ABC transport system permease protein